MKKVMVSCTLISFLLIVNGCAWISTYPARPHNPRGIRVIPQKIYLFIDGKNNKLVSLPDLKNAYDVKPRSFLAKHDFTITIEAAQTKQLISNQDSTAALALLQKIVELAAAAANPLPGGRENGSASAKIDIDLQESSFGFATGIYELSETGLFKKVALSP